MIYTYLFEVKGIQAYLFRSGKLKDVIAASGRLDQLIDSTSTSVLANVIEGAGLSSDLLESNLPDAPNLIRFLRCKGGAMYAYCDNSAPLLALRSAWTLAVQQLFPSIEFTDAFCQSDTLDVALAHGHQQLAASRNNPTVKLPLASAICSREARSGLLSVPLSPLARRATHKDDPATQAGLDMDSERHRQAYQSLQMREAASLQARFTPPALANQIRFPIDLELGFDFGGDVKDIALIHIDGNGLGKLLRHLKQHLANQPLTEYRQGFREFSNALAQATMQAAQKATQWLYEQAAYQQNGQTYVPLRPIVLGGDDLTLLCRADYAMGYAERFCNAFKQTSKACLKPLFKKHFKGKSGITPYLTASGGILFHKAGHPFTRSHDLVEQLCHKAKVLTKSSVAETDQIGPAALAFHRLSTVAHNYLESMLKQTLQFANRNGVTFSLGRNAYFVTDDDNDNAPRGISISDIQRFAQFCRSEDAPVSMNRWRQMATHLANGDYQEAQRIYCRALSLCNNPKALAAHEQWLLKVAGQSTNLWHWPEGGVQQSVINDLLVIDHFEPNLIDSPTCETRL